jgi:glycosyltransferase involved in cell wall biosynthesis
MIQRSDSIPVISIVTPSYNQGQFIGETIRSVLSQEGTFYIDYIIMDGLSTDASLSIIERHERVLRKSSQRLEKQGLEFCVDKEQGSELNRCKGISYRWTSKKDGGQAHAINAGLKLAVGSVCAYINSDDLYYPGAFDYVARCQWADTDFLYGKGMWISETGGNILPYPTLKPSKRSFYYECTLCQPAVFIKKGVVDDIGLFSTAYDFIFDYEYWLRALFKRKKFVFANRLLAKSRMHFGNKSLSNTERADREKTALLGRYYGTKKPNALALMLARFFVKHYTGVQTGRMRKFLRKTKQRA